MRWNEITRPSKEELLKILNMNKSIEEIAEDNFVSISTLQRWRKYYGLIKPKRVLNSELNVDKLVKLYNLGYDSNKIGQMYNTNGNKILERIRDKVKIKRHDIKKKNINMNLVEQLIHNGKTTIEIAKMMGCSQPLITSRCKEYGIIVPKRVTEKQIKARQDYAKIIFFKE